MARILLISNRWVDIGIGIASGLFAFNQSQLKNVPEDQRLFSLLKRGYNIDQQKERLAAEAELEKEASAELAKLLEGEQTNTSGARS